MQAASRVSTGGRGVGARGRGYRGGRGRGRGGGRGRGRGVSSGSAAQTPKTNNSNNNNNNRRKPKEPSPLASLPVKNSFPLIDIGLNLSHRQFDSDREDVYERALSHGVNKMILTGTSEKHSVLALKLAASHPGNLYSTVGVHPHDAKSCNGGTMDRLRSLLKKNAGVAVAVGECGLDFDRNFSPPEKQIEVFKDQISLGHELGLPLFCHERKAFSKFVDVLESVSHGPVCVHCFTGTRSELEKYIQLGYYIGITGWICDERRGLGLRDIVSLIPLDKLMIETDAPFLTPRNLPSPYNKVRRNEPCLLPTVLETLSECMNVEIETLARQSTANAISFFGLSSE
eukprot:TRINITY_DN139_c3_g1_i2.p1 TRINITY_DN139_c3_g1~~TRINITY_DN139_c3_g1_i2.p1  ORF type:complete len:343 (+),score=51.91 TRINITY_DN139_c3_g1_i2:10-1038(+)